MIGKGRSFAPATLAHLAHGEEDVFEEVTLSQNMCWIAAAWHNDKPLLTTIFDISNEVFLRVTNHTVWPVAQLVEHRTSKPKVAGSNPSRAK